MTEKSHIILGIDPGSEKSGVILLADNKIEMAANLENEEMFTLIDRHTMFTPGSSITIVYEDIRPYTSRFNLETINTCKIIGRLEYVLKQHRVSFRAITRNEVKSFVFKVYCDLIIPEIEKKILRKGKTKKDGTPLKPSFQYVDDRIVQKAMRAHWNIPIPKPGKCNIYGLKTHSWQALGAVSCYLHLQATFDAGVF